MVLVGGFSVNVPVLAVFVVLRALFVCCVFLRSRYYVEFSVYLLLYICLRVAAVMSFWLWVCSFAWFVYLTF